MSAPGFGFESTDPFTPQARHIAVVSGGLSDPSVTRLLADRLADATAAALSEQGILPELHVIELRRLATAVADALVTHNNSTELQAALDAVEQADAIIAITPTFKASYSGLFKSFWDLFEERSIAHVPVLLGATGGTPRHSLMIDTALRPLFSYFRAKVIPTAVFAAADDWGDVVGGQGSRRDDPLDKRIAEAGSDLASVVGCLPARERRATNKPKPLTVTPFGALLRGLQP